jgi:hypothetical protein
MTRPSPHTAENSTPTELRTASIRLAIWLLVIALLVVPVLRNSPLGPTGSTAILAWLLVAVSLYWLLAGLGYRPLLVIQLIAFSLAVVFLATKAGLVLLGIDRLSILRRIGRGLIWIGALSAGLNLGAMLLTIIRSYRITFASPPP